LYGRRRGDRECSACRRECKRGSRSGCKRGSKSGRRGGGGTPQRHAKESRQGGKVGDAQKMAYIRTNNSNGLKGADEEILLSVVDVLDDDEEDV
jgi:hypothetical protein